MADNSLRTPGSGETIRTIEKASGAYKTGVSVLDIGGSGAESLVSGSNPLPVTIPAVTTGGATAGRILSVATTNATSVKGSAGTLYSLMATNVNAAVRYLKVYNKASAPSVGTDVPVWTVAIPGATTGGVVTVPIPAVGVNFSLGIAMALVTGAADSDTTAVAANELLVNYSYK
jgi:hypothetical protein